MHFYFNPLLCYEKFEVSEGVIRSRKSRDTIQWAKDKGEKDKQ
jgi:hypothetical protein